MKSMTGYGRAVATIGGRAVAIEVRSVNRRALDLAVSLPGDWESLEARVAEQARRFAMRGKVHVAVEVEGPPPDELAWDEAGVAAALARLAALAAGQGVPFAPTPELLWQIASSRRKSPLLPPAEDALPEILPALDAALRAFAAMRSTEGESLLADLVARMAALRRLLEAVAARAPGVPSGYREALLKRLREAGLELDLDDERVLREIALFADRCDISEEITRFRSHLDQFSALLAEEGEVGRKAEFILQELGREVHTMGAKANDLGISRHVIEMKNELEKVKEQIANVE